MIERGMGREGVSRTGDGRSGLRFRVRRRGRVLAAGIGLAAAGLPGTASSHWDPVPIPPDSGFLVRWYQPHSVQPIEDWEIEITPRRNPGSRYIATAQVMPDESCWALNVPIDEAATVRVRSVSGDQVSAWSRTTSVPEPGLATGLAAATGLLVCLTRRRPRAERDQSS